MKKLMVLIASLFIAVTILAQEDHNTVLSDAYYDKVQQGFILTKEGTKIPCEIQLSHPAALGDRLILTKSAGGRAEWDPNDLAGFIVNGDFWISRSTGGIKNRYCMVSNDGAILTYDNIMYKKEGDNTMKRNSQLLRYTFIQKGNEKPKMWATISLNVKKHLIPMIQDNSEMKAQIEKEDVTITDAQIEKYILVYNEWYYKGHPEFKMRKDRASAKVASDRKHPVAGTDLNDALSKLTKEKKVTLAEKVAKFDQIPVYFMKEISNVQCSGFGPTGTALPSKTDWIHELDEARKKELMKYIIADLNFLFKTDKFVDGGDYPGKKHDFKGDGVDFYVKHQIYGRYEVSELNSKNLYDIKYKLHSNQVFMELNEKGKWKSAKKIEYMKYCKKSSPKKFYNLDNFTKFIPLECPVDVLKEEVELNGIKWVQKQFPNG